ncbi:MAG: HD domain-containing protein [Patescibacteria group bacterium]
MNLLEYLYPINEIFVKNTVFTNENRGIEVDCIVPSGGKYTNEVVSYVTAENYVRCLSQASYLLTDHLIKNGLIPFKISESEFIQAMISCELYYRDLMIRFHKKIKKNESFKIVLRLKDCARLNRLDNSLLFSFKTARTAISAEISFIFIKKKYSLYPLEFSGKYQDIAQRVVNKLHEVPRTGWVDRGVKNPETVGEHTDKLVSLAEIHFNIPGLSKMLKIHDWAESCDEVGDLRTDSYCSEDTRKTTQEKHEAEFKAMKKICATLGQSGVCVMELWLEYEKRQTKRAKIAYQLDKLQGILKSIEYQKNGQPVIAQEFINYDGGKIENPKLKRLLTQAQQEI